MAGITRRAAIQGTAMLAAGGVTGGARTGPAASIAAGSDERQATLFAQATYFADQETKPSADSSGFPHYAGGVFRATQSGATLCQHVTGWALYYADREGAALPAERRIAVRDSTMFDIASLTEILTAVLTMRLVEAGVLSLSTTIATFFPEAFGSGEKAMVTVKMLLTHTAGFPSGPTDLADVGTQRQLLAYPTREARRDAVVRQPLLYTPGRSYLYSDVSMLVLGMVLEKAGSASLDDLLKKHVTAPLGMTSTEYFPTQPSSEFLSSRVAATEFANPATYGNARTGLIWGQVHDPNAWALGGVAGHAGVFSTAADLQLLCDVFLDRGKTGNAQFLSGDTVAAMLTNHTAHLTAFGGTEPADAQGLGWELDQSYLGEYRSPATASHTGFTGTTLAFNTQDGSSFVMLTNRLHPRGEWGVTTPSRAYWGTTLSRALR